MIPSGIVKGDPTKPVVRGPGVDPHGNPVTGPIQPEPVINPGSVLEPSQRKAALHPEIGPYAPVYNAPPTDSFMMGIGTFDQQPVNPTFFTSYPEAFGCLQRLIYKGVVPQDAQLVDESFALYPLLVLGHDGRRVWCIEFALSGNPPAPSVNISTPVGKILFYEFTYPNKRLVIQGSGITIDIATD